jgi:hypothetical protein
LRIVIHEILRIKYTSGFVIDKSYLALREILTKKGRTSAFSDPSKRQKNYFNYFLTPSPSPQSGEGSSNSSFFKKEKNYRLQQIIIL